MDLGPTSGLASIRDHVLHTGHPGPRMFSDSDRASPNFLGPGATKFLRVGLILMAPRAPLDNSGHQSRKPRR